MIEWSPPEHDIERPIRPIEVLNISVHEDMEDENPQPQISLVHLVPPPFHWNSLNPGGKMSTIFITTGCLNQVYVFNPYADPSYGNQNA